MAHLDVTVEVGQGAVSVRWRLDGVALAAGATLGQLAVSVAGAPTVDLGDGAVTATDGRGSLALVMTCGEDDDGDLLRWVVGRPTSGPIEISYLAEPVADEARAATPPLELRAENGGLSGALKCFLLLPPGPDDLPFTLRWVAPEDSDDAWQAVCSLGEGDGDLTGAGLELLGDTYAMCGHLSGTSHRDGQLSTWWLTPPGIDVGGFAVRLDATYRLMAETFDAPAHPYRVFLRTHPHRGVNGSAHPASFVMALNPEQPLLEASLYETLAHELAHEWLHLDGPAEDVTWFTEGSADYYSLVVPFRAGLLDETSFLEAVNLEAREGYANPRRDLGVREAQALFFSDFAAHRLPYVRGMFYLADLDARLRAATYGGRSVDDVVRSVVRRRRDGHRVGVDEWCALVGDHLGDDEWPSLDGMVFTGTGRPASDSFGPGFALQTVEAPVLDLGFEPSTLVERRVRGLVAGGPADRAGLREGEPLELPSYSEIVRLRPGDVLEIGVTRSGTTSLVGLPLEGETVSVPSWSRCP